MKKEFDRSFALFAFLSVVFLFSFAGLVSAVGQFAFSIDDFQGNFVTVNSGGSAPTLYTTATTIRIETSPLETLSETTVLYRSSFPNSEWFGSQIVGNNGDFSTISGLDAGTDYQFEAELGDPERFSSAIIYVKRSSITTVTASSYCGPARVDLSWAAVSGSGIYYNIFRNDIGSGVDDLAHPLVQVSTNSYTDTNVAPSTSYTYKIRALQNGQYLAGGEATVSATTGACEVVLCGDGITQTSIGEQCDWGNSSTPSPNNGDVCTAPYGGSCQYCTAGCTFADKGGGSCGDETIQNPPEQCDNGTLNSNTGACTAGNATVAGCKNAFCGDGYVRTGMEACDDGNTINTDSCTNSCTIPPTAPQCVFSGATWSTTSATEGQTVSLIVTGANCSGRGVTFSISPSSGLTTSSVSGTFGTTSATSSWISDYVTGGSNSYSFVARLTDNASVSRTSNSSLTVIASPPGGPVCGDGVIESPEQCEGSNLNGQTCQTLGYGSGTLSCSSCSFVTSGCTSPPPACVLTPSSATWSTSQATEGNIVSLSVQGTNCDGKTVSFVVREYDTVSTDDPVTTNPVNVVFSGNGATGAWTAEWQDDGLGGGNPEYFFTATVATVGSISSSKTDALLLHVNQSDVAQCSSVSMCGDYTDLTSCTLDECSIADGSVPSSVNCDASGISCSCVWNSGTSLCEASVGASSSTGSSVGTCRITQSSSDNCNDGFLTFSWTALWTFAPGKTAADDTNGLQAKCIDGSKTTECPAQIALPFVSTYSIIGALILIALVYWALSTMKSRSRKATAGKEKSSSRKKRI